MDEERLILEKMKTHLLGRAAVEQRPCCQSMPGRRRPIEVGKMRELLSYIKKCRGALITFYSPTCPYCRAFAPIYAEAAEAYGDILPFLGVNAWSLPEAAEMFGVMGVPMTFGVSQGRVVGAIYGYAGPEALDGLVHRVLEEAGCTRSGPA